MARGESRTVPIPGEQRVFSLVLALVASPYGLTKRELLSSVYGYSGRFRHGVIDPTLERQFERDKEQIRSLGIPVEAIDAPEEPGNNQLTRYRIRKELLQQPESVRFSARELTLLRLASLAWAEGSLSAESRRATMKLESLGVGLEVQHLGIAPSISIPERAAPPLQRAIDESRTVRFEYRLPSRDAPLERYVAPLRLHRADGRWHLIGHDLDREARRVFLLSRITGEVRMTAERFDAALRDGVEAAVVELEELRDTRRATVDVRDGSVAQARLEQRARPGRSSEHRDPLRLDLGTLDYAELADELAGYGAEAAAVAPGELRAGVIERLRLVKRQHGQASDAPGERDG